MTAEGEEKKMKEKTAKWEEKRPQILTMLAIVNWLNVILMGIAMILRFYNRQ